MTKLLRTRAAYLSALTLCTSRAAYLSALTLCISRAAYLSALTLCTSGAAYLSALTLCISLAGCTLQDDAETRTEATAFANSTLKNYATAWDPQVLIKVTDPRIAPKDIEDLSSKFHAILGPLKSMDELKFGGSTRNFGIGTDNPADFIANYSTSLECQNDVASAKLSVAHENNGWRVLAIDINSSLLDKENAPQITAAKNFVDSVAPKIFAGSDLNFIEKNADPDMLKSLRQNSLASLALVNLPKTFGHFKSYDGAKYVTVIKDHSRDIYEFDCTASYDARKGSLAIHVVEEPSGWKIRFMNLNTGGVISNRAPE